MIHRWHAPHYQHVPLWLWPAVWWWLRRVDQWTELTGRRVFVEVAPDGTVYSPWWDGMFDTWDDETGEQTHTSWQPGDMNPHLPGRLATALTPAEAQWHAALSAIHRAGKAPAAAAAGINSKCNLLRRPCRASGLAGVQTQTYPTHALQLGLPPPTLSSRKSRLRLSGTQKISASEHWVPALR
ncbi:MAG: hypothetical protein AAF768_12450 [Pseudomonadota bacterium]